ncbi:MAG: SIMPL domain-containing protein [Pyrinomonadaceae bacterium]
MKMFLFLSLSISAVIGVSAQSIDVTRAPTVQVTGTAEIFVVPDEATFYLKVARSDKNLVTAKNQNDENIGKILALTKRFNIDSKDVKTDFITVTEKFDRKRLDPRDEEYSNVFVGYTVSKTVIVKLKDLKKFEEFFGDVVKIGVTQISNVSFQSSELRKYKDQARLMAIRAAREKAVAIAGAINQEVGKAVTIEEKDIDGFRSPYANSSSNSFSISDDRDGTDTVAIGTISVKAQVEVQFLLS